MDSDLPDEFVRGIQHPRGWSGELLMCAVSRQIEQPVAVAVAEGGNWAAHACVALIASKFSTLGLPCPDVSDLRSAQLSSLSSGVRARLARIFVVGVKSM